MCLHSASVKSSALSDSPGKARKKQCKVLSGGEKIRLCFARIFVNPPNFLVLDEPTTHLDIAAREALQQAICNYTGTVCIVSHDIEFLRGTVTGIVEMRSPGTVCTMEITTTTGSGSPRSRTRKKPRLPAARKRDPPI